MGGIKSASWIGQTVITDSAISVNGKAMHCKPPSGGKQSQGFGVEDELNHVPVSAWVQKQTRRMRSPCCARATSGHAAAVPAITFMKSLRLMSYPRGLGRRYRIGLR